HDFEGLPEFRLQRQAGAVTMERQGSLLQRHSDGVSSDGARRCPSRSRRRCSANSASRSRSALVRPWRTRFSAARASLSLRALALRARRRLTISAAMMPNRSLRPNQGFLRNLSSETTSAPEEAAGSAGASDGEGARRGAGSLFSFAALSLGALSERGWVLASTLLSVASASACSFAASFSSS